MTDEVTGPGLDGSVDAAARALEALLSRQPEQAKPEVDDDDEGEQDVAQAISEKLEAPEVTPEPEVEAKPEPQPEAVQPDVKPEPVQPKEAKPDPDVERRLREADQIRAQSDAQRTEYLNQLNALVSNFQAAFAGEFGDIKSIGDLQNLARTNPDRYNDYVFAQMRLQEAVGVQQREKATEDSRQQQAFNTWADGEARKLGDLIPDLKDKDKGGKLMEDLRSYAKERGYTPQQLAMASATDWHTLYEAKQYRDYKAGEAKKAEADAKALEEARKKAANAPPVQKPGAPRETSAKDQKVQERFQQFKKSGHPDDLATLLRETGLA